MSRRRTRIGRTVDKWSQKELYKIVSPDSLEVGKMTPGSQIGETVASDPNLLEGRTLEVSLKDLTGNYSLSHIKLKFQITEVTGNNAKTMMVGHSMSMDYIKSIVKRRRSRIDSIQKIETKDGYPVRVTSTAVTTHRCKSSQEKAIRQKMMEIVNEKAENLNHVQFLAALVGKETNKELYTKCTKIFPLSSILVQKSKLLKTNV